MLQRLNPLTLITRLKKVYSVYALSLPLKLKVYMLAIIAIFLLDNILGISYTVITNSRIDTIEHMIESKPQMSDTYMINYKRQLAHEYINHHSMVSDFTKCLSSDEDIEGRVPLFNTLTSALLLISLIIILTFIFARLSVLDSVNLYHHLTNYFIALFILIAMTWAIQGCALQVPQLCDGWNYNYALYVIINIAIYGTLMWLLPEIPAPSISVLPASEIENTDNNDIGSVSRK